MSHTQRLHDSCKLTCRELTLPAGLDRERGRKVPQQTASRQLLQAATVDTTAQIGGQKKQMTCIYLLGDSSSQAGAVLLGSFLRILVRRHCDDDDFGGRNAVGLQNLQQLLQRGVGRLHRTKRYKITPWAVYVATFALRIAIVSGV